MAEYQIWRVFSIIAKFRALWSPTSFLGHGYLLWNSWNIGKGGRHSNDIILGQYVATCAPVDVARHHGIHFELGKDSEHRLTTESDIIYNVSIATPEYHKKAKKLNSWMVLPWGTGQIIPGRARNYITKPGNRSALRLPRSSGSANPASAWNSWDEIGDKKTGKSSTEGERQFSSIDFPFRQRETPNPINDWRHQLDGTIRIVLNTTNYIQFEISEQQRDQAMVDWSRLSNMKKPNLPSMCNRASFLASKDFTTTYAWCSTTTDYEKQRNRLQSSWTVLLSSIT